MCRHCKRLTEDKEIVHAFMETAAARLTEKHKQKITADDLSVKIELTVRDPNHPLIMLDQLTKEHGTLW